MIVQAGGVCVLCGGLREKIWAGARVGDIGEWVWVGGRAPVHVKRDTHAAAYTHNTHAHATLTLLRTNTLTHAHTLYS